MGERRGMQDRVAGRDRQHVGEERERHRVEVAVRDHDTLAPPGRALV